MECQNPSTAKIGGRTVSALLAHRFHSKAVLLHLFGTPPHLRAHCDDLFRETACKTAFWFCFRVRDLGAFWGTYWAPSGRMTLYGRLVGASWAHTGRIVGLSI